MWLWMIAHVSRTRDSFPRVCEDVIWYPSIVDATTIEKQVNTISPFVSCSCGFRMCRLCSAAIAGARRLLAGSEVRNCAACNEREIAARERFRHGDGYSDSVSREGGLAGTYPNASRA